MNVAARAAGALLAAAALLQPAGPAAASNAACGKVMGAGSHYDAARGNCVAPNTLEPHCMRLPGYIRWQRTERLGTCEFAVPRTGASRLPPPAPESGRPGLRVPAGCAEAKQNVDWVMLRDAGAWRSYGSARRTRGPFDSLLYAQRHNPHAQLTIRRCAGWADAYARLLERNGRVPDTSGPGGSDERRRPVRWGALAAGIEEGRTDRVGVGAAWGRASRAEAVAEALRYCRQYVSFSSCRVIDTYSSGCGFISSGRNARGKVGWGSGPTAGSAQASCTARGLTCDRPIGGCVD